MLFRKMLRDIKANKSQFIAIFLMIFLGVFIFTGINSEWNGMRVNAEHFYQEANLADVIVYGEQFKHDDLQNLMQNKHIKKVERRALLNAHVKDKKTKKIQLYMLEENNISKMKVVKGESYSKSKDGIWIDKSYADENHLDVNDRFVIEMNGYTLNKTIKGLILHPEFVYQNTEENVFPDHLNHGYAMISSKFFPYIEQVPFTQLIIDSSHSKEIEKIVSDTLQSNKLTFIQKKDLQSYSMLQAEITQHQAFGQIFPLVFLLIAVLTTITTVSKLIINQRQQCGILKALGFKNKKIIFHYFSHIIFITTIGAILGFIIGPIIVPSMLYPLMKVIYVLPKWYAIPFIENIFVVIGSILLCFLTSYIVGYRQLIEKPTDMLRPATHTIKIKRISTNTISNTFNFYTRWNIRDIFRNKIRSLIAVVGVCGCMGLMLCALGMQDSMDNMMYTMFEKLQTYEMKVQINEQANSQEIKASMQGSELLESGIELKHEHSKKNG